MTSPGLATPVVLIVFRRPEVTRRSLEVLREATTPAAVRDRRRPRPGPPQETAQIEAVRALIEESVDWPCVVERRYAERNLGLEASVELGLDWVFSQVDRAIVLEDDCIPDPTFFRFCEELLERYSASHGSGSCPAIRTTWRSRPVPWPQLRLLHLGERLGLGDMGGPVAGAPQQSSSGTMPGRRTGRAVTADGASAAPHAGRPAPATLVTDAAMRHFTQVAGETNGDLRGWDHHWWVTIMSRQGLSIMPSVTLVENDGYGEGATHTRAEKDSGARGRDDVPVEPPRGRGAQPRDRARAGAGAAAHGRQAVAVGAAG